MKDWRVHVNYDIEFEARKWSNEIPFIRFYPTWEVRVIPPFGGATVRFLVRDIGTGKEASVYLDCYDNLGCVGEPYWEVYPGINGDVDRFMMADTKGLLDDLYDILNSNEYERGEITS